MIIELLYNSLNNYFNKIKLNNYNFKINKIKNIELIETHFIPDKIRKYIEKNITIKYTILYNFKNKLIKLNYFTKKKIDTKIFNILLKRIIFIMLITNTYINVNIFIYDTPFKKKFNCNNSKNCGVLHTHNVNSGLNYDNNIIIFRKEEYKKLLLHELIHALDVDYKYETIKENKKLLELFNINTKNLLINESYVETWAIILNTYCVLRETNTNSLNNFKLNLKKELAHSLIQCSKLCIYYNIDDFSKIYNNHKNTIYYKDNVNTFSYHIVKTINLYNIRNFLKNFKDDKYILKKKYKYDLYTKFIIKHNSCLSNKINLIIKKYINKNLNSLTMSSI